MRRNNWKYQSGLLPESQGAGALPAAAAGSALRIAVRLCLRPKRVALPCRGRAGRPFSVGKWRFGVENGSERRLRRGRSRPRGLVVTVSGAWLFFSMSAVNAVPFSEHDPTFYRKIRVNIESMVC